MSIAVRKQRSEPGYFDDVDGLADAFDPGRPDRLEGEISFAKPARVLGGGDRTGRCERLHPCGQAGRMPNRGVFGMGVVSLDRPHHYLAGVDAHSRFHGKVACLAQFNRIAAQLLLDTQRGGSLGKALLR